jgi:hypothetical protein
LPFFVPCISEMSFGSKGSVDSVLLQLSVEGFAADPQGIGGFLAVAAVEIEQFEDMLFFYGFKGERRVGGVGGYNQFARQAAFRDDAVFRQDNGTLDDVAQLPDIAGPVVAEKAGHGALDDAVAGIVGA